MSDACLNLRKKMFNLDEEKIIVHLAKVSFVFGRTRCRECCVLFSDVGTGAIYLLLIFDTAKFKTLNY